MIRKAKKAMQSGSLMGLSTWEVGDKVSVSGPTEHPEHGTIYWMIRMDQRNEKLSRIIPEAELEDYI